MEHTDKIRPSVVVRRTTPDGRGVSADSPTRPAILVRHLGPGLGGPSFRSLCFGPVVTRGETVFHQYPGTSSNQVVHSRISASGQRTHSGSVRKQHHSTSICEETGRNNVRGSEFRGSISSPVDRVPECRSPTTVCNGILQCGCGFVKPPEPSDRVRVDIGSGSDGRTSSEVAGKRGPVRNFSKLSDPSLLFVDQ